MSKRKAGSSALSGSAPQDTGKVKSEVLNEPGENGLLAKGDKGITHNHQGRSRKRVKLEDEAILTGDLESNHDAPVTCSMRKGTKTEKTWLQVKGDDGDDGKPPLITNSTTPPDSRSNSPTKGQTLAKSKTKQVPQVLATPHPAPPNWKETYDTIKAIRSGFVAPVDTMGCAQAQTGETEPRVNLDCFQFCDSTLQLFYLSLQNRRYATLVALMLSSQTKDEVMNAAIANLRTAFGGSISLEAMIEADENVVSEAISKVGFWRKKTRFVNSSPQKEPPCPYIFQTAISSKLL